MATIVSFVSLKPALLQDLRRAIPDLDFRYLGDGGGRKDRRENHKEGRGESQEEAVSQADIIFGWSPLVERVLRQGRTDGQGKAVQRKARQGKADEQGTAGEQGKVGPGNPPLKWIQTWSAGVDYLPLDLLKELDIVVTTSSGANAPSIAQQTLACLLSWARCLPQLAQAQARKEWITLHGYGEATGKTLLILGTGHIGRTLAGYCLALGMRVVGANWSGHPQPPFERTISIQDADSLQAAVASADFVVNALPLTQETYHLADEGFLGWMKASAYYVNVGRGKTTDTEALRLALEEGRLAGAALDVFEEEPLPAVSPLWGTRNLIITPHTAGLAEDYNRRTVAIFLENWASLQAGHGLRRNLVDFRRQY